MFRKLLSFLLAIKITKIIYNFFLVAIEAGVIGIAIVLFGRLTDFLLNKIFKINLSQNKIEIRLFLIGFLAHLFFEYAGINKWYCKNGIACKN